MIRAKVCLVAEGVTLDHETGLATAFCIQESVKPPAYPSAAQKMTFFCLFEREPSDPSRVSGEFTIALGAQKIAECAIDVDFLQFRSNRMSLRVEGLVIPAPGALSFRLALPGHTAAEYTIRADAPAAQGAAGSPTSPYATPRGSSGFGASPPTVTIAGGDVRVRRD